MKLVLLLNWLIKAMQLLQVGLAMQLGDESDSIARATVKEGLTSNTIMACP